MDRFLAERGRLSGDQVRTLVIVDALVDPDAGLLSLPRRLIDDLGLSKNAGPQWGGRVWGAVWITIQERSCTMEVLEVSDEEPVIIGDQCLLLLDLVIDESTRSLVGNPAHGGEWTIELY